MHFVCVAYDKQHMHENEPLRLDGAQVVVLVIVQTNLFRAKIERSDLKPKIFPNHVPRHLFARVYFCVHVFRGGDSDVCMTHMQIELDSSL